MVNSYKPEVVADSSGKFFGNALRFATREEAEAQVKDLAGRWLLVTDTRVVESDDPVNYRYVGHDLVRVETEDEIARKAERDRRRGDAR